MLRPTPAGPTLRNHAHDRTWEAMDLRLQLLLRRLRTRRLKAQDLTQELTTLRAHAVALHRQDIRDHPVAPEPPAL